MKIFLFIIVAVVIIGCKFGGMQQQGVRELNEQPTSMKVQIKQ